MKKPQAKNSGNEGSLEIVDDDEDDEEQEEEPKPKVRHLPYPQRPVRVAPPSQARMTRAPGSDVGMQLICVLSTAGLQRAKNKPAARSTKEKVKAANKNPFATPAPTTARSFFKPQSV